MILVDIDRVRKDRLIVFCSEQKESEIVGSLLSSELVKSNVWNISVEDFRVLKQRLDSKNLVEREMVEEAFNRVNVYLNRVNKDIEIKTKRYNVDLSFITPTVPYPDQLNGISYLVSHQFVGLFDEMGAGKTFQSLVSYCLLKKYGIVDKMLVICTNEGKSVWEDEIIKHSFNLKYVKVGNGKSVVLSDIDRFRDGREKDVLIVHYDCLNEEVLKRLVDIRFDIVIIDECHSIKNIYAKRTKSVLFLVKNIQRMTKKECYIREFDCNFRFKDDKLVNVVCLTGTPVSENPIFAFPILKVLNHFSVHLKQKFIYYFVEYGKVFIPGVGYVNKPVANKNTDALSVYFEDVSIRRKRCEIKGMPKKVEQVRYIKDISKDFRDLYNKILNEVKDEIENEKGEYISLANASTKFIRLQQVLNNPEILGFSVPSVKYPLCRNIVEEVIESKGKIVIWSIFRKGAELAAKEFKDFGSAYITGELSEIEIQKVRNDFETGKVNVLCATIQKLGTGIDFLKLADTAVYLDLPFSYILYKQSQDRLVRRGKKSSVLLVELFVNNSVDIIVKDMLERKSDWAQSVLDSGKLSKVELQKRLQEI